VRVGLRQAVSDYEGDELHAPELLERLARALSPEDVQLFYQTAIIGRRDLPLAPDPRTGFEMTLLRMIAFRPAGEWLSPRPAAADPAPRPGGAVTGTGAASGSGGTASAAGSTSVAAGGDSWAAIVSALELSGAARQLASHCVLVGRQGAVVRLALDARNQPVRTPAQEEKLAQALSRYFGEPVRLEFQAVTAGAETPALLARRLSEQELAAARRTFDAEPGVQGLRERFGATVLPDTVRPVK
jgi:DNA polymerase III subunit gamma/tau